MKQYKDYIDLMKGIGILLVVIGHGPLKSFAIDVFHMPLFFFITGLTFVPPLLENLHSFVLKKINRIIIPWVFISIVSGLLEAIVGKISPDAPFNGPLWFLPTLFNAIMIYCTLNLLIKQKAVLNVICLSIPLWVFIFQRFLHLNQFLPFALLRAFEVTFFIHLGCLMKNVEPHKKPLFIGLSSIIYGGGVILSMLLYDTNGAVFLNTRAYMYNPLLAHVTSIAGITTMLFLCQLLKKVSWVNWLGKHSLIIMLVHFPLLERLNEVVFYIFRTHDLTTIAKFFITIPAYLLTMGFCVLCIHLFRKFLPKLTGYDNLIPL